jgi:hypothetical protein
MSNEINQEIEPVVMEVKVKKAANFPNFILEIPNSVAIPVGSKAHVYTEKKGNKLRLIYEFEGN